MKSLDLYKEIGKFSEVAGATHYQQIQMLLNRLIADIQSAKKSMQTGNLMEKTKAFTNAAEIVIYLTDCLNMQEGGELAQKLQGIYNHLEHELFFAQLKSDTAKMDKCLVIANNLKNWWDNLKDA